MTWKPTKERPLSWSAISSFEWDKEEWYKRYVLKQKDPPSAAMEFGKLIGERLSTDPTYLPKVPRGIHYEYELRASLAGIPLIGFIDSHTPHTIGDEYKTGRAWDQKKVDQHRQLDMYSLLLHLQDEVNPDDFLWRLTWMPTKETGDFRVVFTNMEDPEVYTFETTRSMRQCLDFGRYIKKVVAEMQAYAESHT